MKRKLLMPTAKVIQQMVIGLSVLFFSFSTFANDMGDSIIRDYPVSLTLPKNRLELSIDYLRIDDATDIFDIPDEIIDDVSTTYHSDTLSDMSGFRTFVNYGLFDKTTIQTSFTYRDMDYGIAKMKVKTFDISWKQNIIDTHDMVEPFLSIDFGFRYDYASDQSFSDKTDINTVLKRIVKGVTLDIHSDKIWFIKDTNGTKTYSPIPKEGNPLPIITNEHMNDYTPYVRLTIGKILGTIFPNLFVEYGQTHISSSVDFSLKDRVPDDVKDRFPEMPIDLDRYEDYVKGGVCVLWKYPYSLMGRIEYQYLKMFRDSGLDEADDNHIVKADMNWFITPRLIFNIGAEYYHCQFNGIIPFLYNEYTQTTFDHHYGRFQIGVSYLFGR